MSSIPKWDILAETWLDDGSPAQPSASDLNIYRRFVCHSIKCVASSRIMILGCTPGLRKLLARLEVPVTCVDISKKMLAKTSTLVSSHNSLERLVRQDWLRLDLAGAKFSCIIGDMVLDNVPYERWHILKQGLIAHLLEGGFLITRAAPRDASRGASFAMLLSRCAKLYDCGVVSLEGAASDLWEKAVGASAVSIPGKLSASVFSKEIESLNLVANRLKPSEASVLAEFTNRFGAILRYEWTAYRLENIVDAFSNELTLVKLARADDYPAARRYPILMFKYSLDSAQTQGNPHPRSTSRKNGLLR